MMSEKLRDELKKLANLSGVDSVSKQLTTYEKRVREMVQDLKKDLDSKGRDVRAKGSQKLDMFSAQVKKTRAEVEKQVRTVVNHEGKRLNEGLTELVSYLKSLSKQEKATPVKKATKAKAEKVEKEAKSASAETKSAKAPAKPKAKRKSTASTKSRSSASTNHSGASLS